MAITAGTEPTHSQGATPRGRWSGTLLAGALQTRGAIFGLAVIAVVLVLAVGADLIAPYGPTRIQAAGVLAPPSLSYLLGTDQIGRDVSSRIIYGASVSIQAGVVSVGLALVLGVLVGLLAGYYGGWVDELLMRVVDALYAFPALLLALAVTAILGPGLTSVMLAIGVVFAPAFARLVRGQTLSIRERDFITAAHVVGVEPWRVMLVHIWPNVTAPIIVQASLLVGSAIVIEAGLSFLGLGVMPPTPSWGSMLKEGYQYMEQAPWLAFAPGAAIFLTVLAFNLVGDALQRALDPRLRRTVGA
ncbi:MAG TPA: ABC transporter permease [Chloroflexota bacterium]|nr:ABC transporter permease [Chloroflexota bacterium]